LRRMDVVKLQMIVRALSLRHQSVLDFPAFGGCPLCAAYLTGLFHGAEMKMGPGSCAYAKRSFDGFFRSVHPS
jgi:hypothetical protein